MLINIQLLYNSILVGSVAVTIKYPIEAKFFNEYIEEQRKNAMLDYNDLINIFLYILSFILLAILVLFKDKIK